MMPIRQPENLSIKKTTRTGVYIPRELRAEVAKQAQLRGITQSQFICEAISRFIKQTEKKGNDLPLKAKEKV